MMEVEAAAHDKLADEAFEQIALPPLLATDFGMAVCDAHRLIARAARAAADVAGMFADETTPEGFTRGEADDAAREAAAELAAS